MQTFKIEPTLTNSTFKPTEIRQHQVWYARLPGDFEVKLVKIDNIPINRVVAVAELDQYGCSTIKKTMYFVDDVYWIEQFVEG